MENKLLSYPRLPEDLVCITTYFDDEEEYYEQFGMHHYAVDMAYTSRWQGGPKYVFAAADGVIAWRQDATDKLANALRIEHTGLIEGKKVVTRYFHMASIADGMTVGRRVNRGEIIGIEGKTGHATGPHLHFEFWICPENYCFKSSDIAKYAADPLIYCFLYPDQAIGYDPKNEVRRLPEIVEEPLPDGSEFECLKSNALYCRTAPEVSPSTADGLLPKGSYPAFATCENGGYLWVRYLYKDAYRYSALLEGYSNVKTPEEPIDYKALYESELAKNEVLTAENEKLKTDLSEAETKVAALSSELDEIKAALAVLRKY